MKAQAVLTVSESKRLIAKAVAKTPQVEKALEKGLIAIATGTTNSYIVEEILGKTIDKTSYRSGLTLPAKPAAPIQLSPEIMPDVVLKDGKTVPDLDRFSAVQEMQAGDVFIKGCNALHYPSRTAGILIGLESGGTIGGTIGHIVGRSVNLILPVGLEKAVFGDFHQISRALAEPDESVGYFPRMMPVWGTIITEIEALETLTGVRALHIASGGVAGAEGAVRLLFSGNSDQVNAALKLVEQVQGEPPWAMSAGSADG
jgi:hypothetical protein